MSVTSDEIGKVNRQFQRMISQLSSKTAAGLAIITTGLVGTVLLVSSHAATPAASIETESGAVSSPASAASDTTASGGSAVKFAAGGGTGSCTGTAGQPGGADPWGGCWPGVNNTGVPAGTSLAVVNGNQTYSTANQVISGLDIRGCVFVTAPGVVIKNSKISCPSSPIVCSSASMPAVSIRTMARATALRLSTSLTLPAGRASMILRSVTTLLPVAPTPYTAQR
jgi:hypothetical protein